VQDTQKRLDTVFVHQGDLRKGTLRVGDAVELHVEGGRRSKLRANHSVTHLLHEALRRQLGDHVTQKGSLVSPDYLRFDFSHPKPVEDAELAAVEDEVNARIRGNSEVTTRLMTPDAAVDVGALALFGEKYGEEVRVVAMGGDEGGERFSVELCGGTHVSRTGDIGYFKITSESAVAAGVRRIEAVTGGAAVAQAKHQAACLREAAAILKAAPDDLPDRIGSLLDERRRMERELSDLRRKVAMGGGDTGKGAASEVKTVAGVSLSARVLADVPAKELKPLADSLKSQIGSGVVALVSVSDGKASLVVGVTDDLTAKLNAVDLVRAGSAALGGKGGGGRPDMAQAGGPDGAAAAQAIAAIEEALAAQA
jgi:alanyl-tRNA synthetase